MSNCADIGRLSLPERKGVVTDRGLCWTCLNTGHSAKMCRKCLICSVCTKRHPSILHDDNFVLRYGAKTQPETVIQQPETAETKLAGRMDVYSVDTAECTVYHGVLPVLIYAKYKPEKSILTYGLYPYTTMEALAASRLMSCVKSWRYRAMRLH